VLFSEKDSDSQRACVSTQHGWQREIMQVGKSSNEKLPSDPLSERTCALSYLFLLVCAAMPKQPCFKNRHLICKHPYQPVGIEPMLRGSIGIANGDKALEVSDGLKLPPNQTSGMQRWCRRERSVAFVSEIRLVPTGLTLKRNMVLHTIFRASVLQDALHIFKCDRRTLEYVKRKYRSEKCANLSFSQAHT
jgi:hypothetical protein